LVVNAMTTEHNTAVDVSRIDKLWLDRDGLSPEAARRARMLQVPGIYAGADVAETRALQVALLTAVNLARKCFSVTVPVHAPAVVWDAPSLTGLSPRAKFGDALADLGAVQPDLGTYQGDVGIIIGDAQGASRCLRVTFDGWCVLVGPAESTVRLRERDMCTMAPLAAAATAVGEVFSRFARVNVTATYRRISFSLWRPELPIADAAALGELVGEFPVRLALFGLGHLGQAYLWAVATLPLQERADMRLFLCDDDDVERPNVETGAVLQAADIGRRKTRVACAWIEARGFKGRLLERLSTRTIDAVHRSR
jgi:hypothetical protein